jgi:lysyl-tRNA synthetase class 2
MQWLDSLRKEGVNPYPHKFARDLRIDEYVTKFGNHKGCATNGEFMEDIVAISGRVKLIRSAGKSLFFFDLTGDDQKVQLMVNKQFYTADNWEALNTVRRGDIIGAIGNPGRT